jgi:hypothetical protein
MHLYRFSFSGVDDFISLNAGLSTKTNYVKHEIFSRSITLLVIISRISNDLRCKTFFSSSIERKKCGKLIYLPTHCIDKFLCGVYRIRYILKHDFRVSHTLFQWCTDISGTTLYSRYHYCHQQKS